MNFSKWCNAFSQELRIYVKNDDLTVARVNFYIRKAAKGCNFVVTRRPNRTYLTEQEINVMIFDVQNYVKNKLQLLDYPTWDDYLKMVKK